MGEQTPKPGEESGATEHFHLIETIGAPSCIALERVWESGWDPFHIQLWRSEKHPITGEVQTKYLTWCKRRMDPEWQEPLTH